MSHSNGTSPPVHLGLVSRLVVLPRDTQLVNGHDSLRRKGFIDFEKVDIRDGKTRLFKDLPERISTQDY